MVGQPSLTTSFLPREHRLLQNGSSVRSQVLSANLLQPGLLSLWGHKSSQEPAPLWGSHGIGIHLLWHRVFLRLQMDPCSPEDFHGLQRDTLPHQGLHQGLKESLSSSSSSPSSFTDPGVCRAAPLARFHPSLPAAAA